MNMSLSNLHRLLSRRSVCGAAAGLAIVMALGFWAFGGCSSSSSASNDTGTDITGGSGETPTNSAEYRAQVLTNAIHILDNLDLFDEQLALDQVVDRLNQWIHLQKLDKDWQPDSFMDSALLRLGNGYAKMDWVARLPDKEFTHETDGDFLKEATFLRDISKTNRGDKLDDLSIAQNLFDWTVRNIQLISTQAPRPGQKQTDITPLILGSHFPADVLMLGYGTAEQRAWIFILLARQQGLDVAMLATPDPDHPNIPRPWLPALLQKNGDHEELYLFDPALGLPIPGPGGKGIATLAQAINDPTVLDRLDLDDSHHYAIKSAEAKQAIALVEASPGYLSRRMKVLESHLTGSDRLVLTTSPSAAVARLKQVHELKSDPQLWAWPYEMLNVRLAATQAPKNVEKMLQDVFVGEEAPFLLPRHHGDLVIPDAALQGEALTDLMKQGETEMAEGEGKRSDQETREDQFRRRAAKNQRPLKVDFPLTVGRMYQFKHKYDGEQGAKHFYMESRPGDNQMGDWVKELVDDFRQPNQPPPVQRYALAMLRRKQDATYWLGLISFDEKQYEAAEEYLKHLTLDIWPQGPWADGAHYNLARTYESAGRIDEAIALYESDDSAQRHGNHLRARWLREGKKSAEHKTPADSQQTDTVKKG